MGDDEGWFRGKVGVVVVLKIEVGRFLIAWLMGDHGRLREVGCRK